MVLAYHIILTGYGHWLPNDIRGSGSSRVEAARLFPLGEIHAGMKEPAPLPAEVRAFIAAAEPRLEHPLILFDDDKRQAIAEAFATVIAERGYTCYACAIMTTHAHVIIRKHRDRVEAMIRTLKAASARLVCARCCVPASHPVWSARFFKVYLTSGEGIRGRIEYVEQNPVEVGEPVQRYAFVKAYDGEIGRGTRSGDARSGEQT